MHTRRYTGSVTCFRPTDRPSGLERTHMPLSGRASGRSRHSGPTLDPMPLATRDAGGILTPSA
jgi:hypothetical protein